MSSFTVDIPAYSFITETVTGYFRFYKCVTRGESDKEISWWKATELRQVMLCTGTYIFLNIMSRDVYVHFLAFTYFMKSVTQKLTSFIANNFSNFYG
ncbi:hypothetical protein J437_LFUL019359 [Ladona fulva]|uniref:Uncharacterized protein n=1 Tax=Ladona fulva TaxID=123851 RepID=A0A8K0PCH2_LADFU|nr:hypothetical protein J437_LFUL019359 [Ladona fulva]